MASRTSAIISELLTVLRANHTTVDLRTTLGTPRVLCPAIAMLPMGSPPLLVISAPRVTPTYESAMGQWRNAGEHEWTLFLASTDDDPSVRANIAIEAAHDIIAAVHGVHLDGGQTTLHELVELLVTLDDVIGEELEDAPGFAIATGRILWVDYPAPAGI